jgi:hypothetical protein
MNAPTADGSYHDAPKYYSAYSMCNDPAFLRLAIVTLVMDYITTVVL